MFGLDHVLDELQHVRGPQQHHRPVDLLGRPGPAGCRTSRPCLGVELDVALGPEGQHHLRDLALVHLVVDGLGDGVEPLYRLHS